MDNKVTEDCERFLNPLSNIPPPPFRVGDIVVMQPSEREIYLKQIELWEQMWEYEMHIHGKREKVFLKWREGTDGAVELEKERQEDVKMEYCRVCKKLQYQVRLWTRQMEIKYFHKERQQWGGIKPQQRV